MPKFYGKIGYAITTEQMLNGKGTGVWIEEIVERDYYGDIIKEFVRTRPSENLNDNIELDNKASIVADPFAYQNFHNMRYILWNNVKWKIKSVDASSRPRLTLWIGGIYNESDTKIETA